MLQVFSLKNDNSWEDIDKPVLFKDYRYYNGRLDEYDYFESDLVAFGDGDVSFEDFATPDADPVPSDFSVAQFGVVGLAVGSVSASTLLDYAPIAGRLVYKPDTADEAKFDLSFVPELAEAGAGTGSTVGDLIAYINGIDQGQFNASIQNGALVIEANDGSEISGELSFDIQTGDFAETVVDIAAASDQGQAEVEAEDATPAEVSIAFDLTGVTSISGYDIRLSVDGNPEVQAFVDGSLGASDLSGVADSLNAGSEFGGLVTFAVENGELVARTDDTGADATLSLVSADLVTNTGVVEGGADPDTAQGSDAVVGQSAQLASVTLSEFAGLSADDTLKDGDYDFEVLVDGTSYTTIITSPDATSSEAITVSDLPALLADAENGSSEALGALVDVSFVPGEGLVLSIKSDAGLAPDAEISVPAGSQADGTNIFNFVDAPVAAVADAVGAVDYDGNKGVTLAAKDGGDDPMNVTGFETDVVSDENSTEQVVSILFFGDSSVDNLTVGSKITVDILGQSLSYTVGDDATGETNATDLSQFYAGKLLEQLEALPEIDAAASSVSLNGDGQTRITLQAATPGQDNLGNVLDSEITVTVERNAGTASDPVLVENSAAAVAEQQAGALVYETSDGGVIINDEDGEGNAVTGRPEETLERSDEGSEGGAPALDTTDVDGQSDDNVDQSVENPSDNAGFYGEAGDTEATQTYTNPDDGFAATEGTPEIGQSAEADDGNAAYAGDPESTGAGNGVTQTHTNPDSGYNAADASPENNSANETNDGDAALSGSEPGQYVEDGLETEFLSGGTDTNGDGVYETRDGTDLTDRVDTESLGPVVSSFGSDIESGDKIVISGPAVDAFVSSAEREGIRVAFEFETATEVFTFKAFISKFNGNYGPDGKGYFFTGNISTAEEYISKLNDALTAYEADFSDNQELGTFSYNAVDQQIELSAGSGVSVSPIDWDLGGSLFVRGTVGLEYSENDLSTTSVLKANGDEYESNQGGESFETTDEFGATIVAGERGTAGASPTEVTDSDSDTDDLSVTEDDAGVPAYSENATVTEVFSGNAAADVITNFQVANDVIGIEGALLGSLGGASFVSVTGAPVFIWEQAVQLEVAEQAPIDPTGSTSALATRSDVLTWDWAADYDGGPIRIEDGAPQFIKVQGDTYLDRYAEWDVSFGIGDNPDLSDGPFDSLDELVAAIEGNQWTGDQGIDIEADVVDGNLEFRVSGVAADDSNDQLRSDFGIDYEWVIRNGPEAKFEMLVRDSELFDLSTTGFGLVDSEASTLEASAIADAEEVAALLRKVFDFSGDTPNAEINTTIFAVTASDDASQTAIWAHTQSSADDDTVEALELNLLGTVETVGDGAGNDEFGIDNFAMSDGAGGWDILSEPAPV